ncbi:high-affinity potassium ion transmembrane transporter [Aureococcus anophagefferens]|nr:high-affinity potassium ion transmembrane transporter [Aureococcus anophagefferens]
MAEDAGEARVRDSSDVELPELPGSKRVSFAAGPEEPCRRSSLSVGGEFLTSSAGGVSEVQQMPYASVVVAWILVVAVVGGSAIHLVERGGRTGASWLDCCFVALNCATATGLATIDVTALRSASLVLMGAFMQLGAATILSLLPIVLRLRALRAALPHLKLDRGDTSPTASLRGRKRRWCQHEAVTFDLRNYKRVPEWLVEYKALLILQRVILAYHAACYLVYGGLIAAYVARVPSARRAATADVVAAPLPWAAFHTLSASVWKSNIQSDFNVAMFLVQVAVLLSICYRDDGFRGETWWTRYNIAAFQAVNTRHAGMTAVALSGLRASALMLQLLMMYLAPVPFVAPSLDDAMIDTRELLMERYPDAAPPCARVALRAAALRFHVRARGRGADGLRARRGLLFLAWFLIAAIMRYEGDGGRTAASGEAAMGGSGALFYIVFELTSAFGNVGLSLGSIADPSRPTSYSGDLTAAALLIVCAVQIFGRTQPSLDAPENLSEAGRPSDLAATTAASAGAEA